MCLPFMFATPCPGVTRGYMAAALLWLFEDPANEGWIKPTGSMKGT